MHFSDKMIAWEPKDDPLTYRLTSISPREAVFENPNSDRHRLYAFRKLDDDTLLVRVGAWRDGKIDANEFRFRHESQRE